ncbi:MAG: tRNA (adenosine(37)-N6)-threonylcarbamoyltransferase complex dimerization subunit type 1 TsaB [bacterium]
MKLLAIDTSGPRALWMGVVDGVPHDPVFAGDGEHHDAVLGEGLRAWLDRNRWESIDAVAVVVGPGGFTGLRVGVAFASGLAEALGVPVVPISTYERLAASVDSGIVWALPFASRREFRGRFMRGGEEPEALSDIDVFSADRIPEPRQEGPIIPLGEGYERERASIDTALGKRRGDADLLDPATALARAASTAWRRGEAITPDQVDVDYGAEFLPTPKGG